MICKFRVQNFCALFTCFLRTGCYSRTFLRVRRYCRGIKPAQRRADMMLRHMNNKRRDSKIQPDSMLQICQNVLSFSKLSIKIL